MDAVSIQAVSTSEESGSELARQDPSVLAIYLEPAPYIVGFIDELRATWRGAVDVLFVTDSLTQPWGYRPAGQGDGALPEKFMSALAEIRWRLAGGRYSLLHLAGWGHPILLSALLLAKSLGVPVTVESDTPRPVSVPLWKRFAKRMAYPWLFSLPKVFLPGGSQQAAYLRDYGVDESRIRIAQMTVDVEKIQSRVGALTPAARNELRDKFGIRKESVCFLYMGRLEPYKGVEDLLEAYRALPPGPDVSLLIAGDGSLRDAVKLLEGAINSVRYMGRLEGDQVWNAYAAADILVLPSRSESWGLVVNEAMAMGLPVIVSDRVGCADDLVQPGVTGLIVPVASPENLAAVMRRMAESSALVASMGAKGQSRISRWTLRNQADRTVAAWQHALT